MYIHMYNTSIYIYMIKEQQQPIPKKAARSVDRCASFDWQSNREQPNEASGMKLYQSVYI